MNILSTRHKAIAALIETEDPTSVRGLDPKIAKKLHFQLSVLADADNIMVVANSFRGWKVHELTPKFPGKWSLWVTGNWRLTFMLDKSSGDITDLDFEDYH
ncbi:type II toxin-antitoxin system RelE/ParE family toxin [Brevundimonas sp.]|uniref:type II toxin-antitoxin system RelE/ParE family toxin n=1 Tax=Brevundimonas sp. TaxID=1871086 RepID=UPI00289CA37E|nr:type II toxin-antitoxin system RelE/ParE family toxin [Brevundimonas sp.]